jgi:hypothetical protein
MAKANFMYELIVNLHIHTTYSDGSGNYSDLGHIALRSDVDVLFITDHNVLVKGLEKYYQEGKKRVLVLTGEEIHDQDREPQKNHLLVFGVEREMAPLADDPQSLINSVKADGGLCFIAHPIDPALPSFGEADISWEDWDVVGFTGIELWNGFSELKSVAKGKWDAVLYGFFPKFIPHGPLQGTLQIWDKLISRGQRVVAIGGSDAHAQHKSLGPLHKVIFPYEYHFSTINTHILVPERLSGDIISDRKMILNAFAAGHCFIGYELPAPTRGFTFYAHYKDGTAMMGDELSSSSSVTLQVKLPSSAEIRLIKDGQIIKTTQGERLVFTADLPGVYRIEAFKHFLGTLRGWIFSNPIYIK